MRKFGLDALGWILAFYLLIFLFATDSAARIDCAVGVDAACARLASKYR